MTNTKLGALCASKGFEKNGFVAIRWLLAFAVIWSHSFPLCTSSYEDELLARVTCQVTAGDLAVNLFLIISGFLVARSREVSVNTSSFLKKRVLRIYPAFAIVILLEAFVIAPLATQESFRGYNFRQLGLLTYNILDLHDCGYPYGGLYETFASNPVPYAMNSSLWTIRYEFICYVLLALAWPVSRHPGVFLTGVAGVWLLSIPVWEPRWGSVGTAILGAAYPWPRLLTHFWAGVTLYRFRNCIPFSKSLACICVALVIAGALTPPHGLRIVTPWCGGYLILYAAFHPWVRVSRLSFLPDYSYGTYLYAWPIQQLLIQRFSSKALEPWSLFVLTVPVSIGCGALSWHLVERPFLRLKQLQLVPTATDAKDSNCG